MDEGATAVGDGTMLSGIRRSSDRVTSDESISFVMDWILAPERRTFPWLELAFTRAGSPDRTVLTKGLCAPQIRAGAFRETWQFTPGKSLPPGVYDIEARFVDRAKQGATSASLLAAPLPLGQLTIRAAKP